jgi:hypothetical protein
MPYWIFHFFPLHFVLFGFISFLTLQVLGNITHAWWNIKRFLTEGECVLQLEKSKVKSLVQLFTSNGDSFQMTQQI